MFQSKTAHALSFAVALLASAASPFAVASTWDSDYVLEQQVGDTANGASADAAISSTDGRIIIFSSTATDLLTGVSDHNNAEDVFAFDRVAGTVELISRSNDTDRTPNSDSMAVAVSTDGRWVLFQSAATDVIGTTQKLDGYTLYLYDRVNRQTQMVSRRNGTTNQAVAADFSFTRMSADGRRILYSSYSSNIIPGGVDNNSQPDIFMYDRDAGTSVLVSHAAAAPNQTVQGYCIAWAISSNGRWAAYTCNGRGLVAGVTDTSSAQKLYLYDHDSGQSVLVSHDATDPLRAVGVSLSGNVQIGPDAEWLIYGGASVTLATGVTGPGEPTQVYAYSRASGSSTLVSHSIAGSNRLPNQYSTLAAASADGRWVAFNSDATDLVAGETDGNGTTDVFLVDRDSGATTLVSHALGQPLTTANGVSTGVRASVSDDGRYLVYESKATNQTSRMGLNPVRYNIYQFDRSDGSTALLSQRVDSTRAVDDDSIPGGLSRDGRWTVFTSSATDLIGGSLDANGVQSDVFLRDNLDGSTHLVSRSLTHGRAAAHSSADRSGISADGRYIVLTSGADDVVPDPFAGGLARGNVYVVDQVTRQPALVSHAAESFARSANAGSRDAVISADGRWIAFVSAASDLVSGGINPGALSSCYLYERETGAVALVSGSFGSKVQVANRDCGLAAISADGRYVAYSSQATDVVPGSTVSSSNDHIYLYDRQSNSTRLVSHAAASSLQDAPLSPFNTFQLSEQGGRVLFSSTSNQFVANMSNPQAFINVFLYDATTDAITLVSRATGTQNQAADGGSGLGALSADGRLVAFSSLGNNLVPGQVDTSGTSDLFLFDAQTASASLLSHVANDPLRAAGSGAFPQVSADGNRIMYVSSESTAISGQSPPPTSFTNGLLLLDRTTGMTRLINRAVPTTATSQNNKSITLDAPTALLSRDGGRVALYAYLQVYDYSVDSDRFSLVSHAEGRDSQVSNDQAYQVLAMSANGGAIVYTSFANDIRTNVVDPRGSTDVFVGMRTDVFIDGFE